MNRVKLSALIREHDTERLITTSKNAIGALANAYQDNFIGGIGALPLAGLNTSLGEPETTSTSSGVIIEDDVSDTDSIGSGVLICTPTLSRSLSVSEAGVSIHPTSREWSFVNTNAILTPSSSSIGNTTANLHYDEETGTWPCFIGGCTKSFKKQSGLEHHLCSAFHTPKLFRCPTSIVMGSPEHKRMFKTIGGLAMHLESGKCAKKGEEALKQIVAIFEKRIQEITGRVMRLLK